MEKNIKAKLSCWQQEVKKEEPEYVKKDCEGCGMRILTSKNVNAFIKNLYILQWMDGETMPRKGQVIENFFDIKYKVLHVERKERVLILKMLED